MGSVVLKAPAITKALRVGNVVMSWVFFLGGGVDFDSHLIAVQLLDYPMTHNTDLHSVHHRI